MGIISEFVREQKRYTKNDLKQIFHLTSDSVEVFIRSLKSFGVMKAVKNSIDQRELSDLVDEDIEIADVTEDDDYLYIFTYVGIITIGSRVIKCYPKYLLYSDSLLNEFKKVLKVIDKYGSKKQIVNLFNGDGENSSFNILAVILFLLNDFHENGIYNNTEDIVEINGQGEILWDKTINEGFSVIRDNRPYYMELYTEKTINDETDFYKHLHQCILTECSKHLKDSDLLDLFDMTEVTLTDTTLNSLGEIEYILYKLQAELNIQFNTRKQTLLKTLYAYVAHNRTIADSIGISMFGTNSFNLIWEDVCSEVFNNRLYSKLEQLELCEPLCNGYKPSDRVIDIIEKPVWSGFDNEEKFIKQSKDTLIPDIITIKNNQFIIMDAKYYSIQLEKDKELRGNPGIGDVTKQYLYQLAFMNFIADHKIENVKNCFIIPTQYNHVVKKGTVMMDMLKNLGLQEIQIRLFPADLLYGCYITQRKLDISMLELV